MILQKKKMRTQVIISILLMPILFTMGCGNDPKQQDVANNILRANVEEKEAARTPLAGRYRGVLHQANGRGDKQVVLVLVPTIMIIQNPGRNDVTERPTLGGNLNIILNDHNPSEILPIAQFMNAMYGAEKNHLRLSGNLNTSSGMGSVFCTLDAKLDGDVLTGTFSNSSIGTVGYLELKKVSSAPINP